MNERRRDAKDEEEAIAIEAEVSVSCGEVRMEKTV
jgi:hypothetical protein